MKLTETQAVWLSSLAMACALGAFEYVLLTCYGISAGVVVL